MAAFEDNFTGTQSSDGLTDTFTDTSNWADNSEGYVRSNFVRTFTFLDAYGTVLGTIVLPTTSNVATLALTADKWVNATLSIVGAQTYTKNYLFPFSRITKNKYKELLKDGCCQADKSEEALAAADRFFRGAEIDAPAGNAAGWQENIDAANAYLTNY